MENTFNTIIHMILTIRFKNVIKIKFVHVHLFVDFLYSMMINSFERQ